MSFWTSSAVGVTAGLILMAASCAAVGTFALLRGRALMGDAVAHAVLPGVCLAFWWEGSKNPAMLLVGAFVTGYVAQGIAEWLPKHTLLKSDAAIALVLSVFFGAGTVLLTFLQGQGLEGQAGLDRFLFGQAAAITPEEGVLFGVLAATVGIVLSVFYPPLLLITFDRVYGRTRGFPVRWLELGLNSLTILAIVLGIQAVGVVLLSALLITPGATARMWQSRLPGVLWGSVAIAGMAVLAGVGASMQAERMPTGPWIVLVLTFFALASLAIAPRNGWLPRWRRSRLHRGQVARENLLKALYQVQEDRGDAPVPPTELLQRRPGLATGLKGHVRWLLRTGEIVQSAAGLQLTAAGQARARALVRRHRLWEVYLNRHLTLPADRVHADAEVVEHVLSPELAEELARQLGYPVHDPHAKAIPRD